MEFERLAEKHLKKWKSTSNRKPLLIRGARQVGKTTLVQKFANAYNQFIHLNLEKPEHRQYFEESDNVKKITEALFIKNNLNPNYENTLLFIDEIQELPKAIQLLRYFYEEIPELHVIAAGSLLEFAMGKVRSFPVGRLSFLYLFPLNFQEFLAATGKSIALEQLNKIPVNDAAHNTLIDLFHTYALIGGMPEIVKTYLEHENIVYLPEFYESLWSTYKSDVEKYASNETEKRVIRHIMETGPALIDKRVKFQHFGQSNYRSREVSDAMRSLDNAKLIQLIYPTTDKEIPVKTDFRKSPRLQFLDTGLINHSLGLQDQLITIKDLSSAYKGALIPHLITQEIISLNILSYKKPHFWVREKTQSSAELDLIIQYKDKVIPVEIKSGNTGSLRSLHQFVNLAPHPFAIRIYGGKYSVEKHQTPQGKPYLLMNMPYYTGTKLPEYIDYFIQRYGQEI